MCHGACSPCHTLLAMPHTARHAIHVIVTPVTCRALSFSPWEACDVQRAMTRVPWAMVGASLVYQRALAVSPMSLTVPYLAFTPVLLLVTRRGREPCVAAKGERSQRLVPVSSSRHEYC